MRIHHLLICDLLIYDLLIHHVHIYYLLIYHLLIHHPLLYHLLIHHLLITTPCAATNREAVSGWANKQYLPTCSHNGWANSHCVAIMYSANIYAIGRNKLMCDMSIGVTVIWVILYQINQWSRSRCLRFDIDSPIYSSLLLLMLNDACVVCQGQVWRGGTVAQERPTSPAFSTSTAEF